VNESQIELSIGETFYVGGYAVTVLDIEGDEIRFRIDSPEDEAAAPHPPVLDRMFRPR